MRTLELICRLVCAGTQIITSSGRFPVMPPLSNLLPKTCPQLRQRWAAMTAIMQTRRVLRKRKDTIMDGWFHQDDQHQLGLSWVQAVEVGTQGAEGRHSDR